MFLSELQLSAQDPANYLTSDDIIDWRSDQVTRLAETIMPQDDSLRFAVAAFEYVRDKIEHSVDSGDARVTITASEVAKEKTGLCFSKTHLLAALLRSKGIPSGLCYQRLVDDKGGHVIHGLLAVHIDGDWHRQDPRGNKPGINAQFSTSVEQLAWTTQHDLGEIDYPMVLVSPHPLVIEALKSSSNMLDIARNGLPSELGPVQ
jgi:transglutaminase-like putative cysteine protease